MLMQACVHLPASTEADEELDTSSLRDCFALAVARSDEFWNNCFDRYTTVRQQCSRLCLSGLVFIALHLPVHVEALTAWLPLYVLEDVEC